MSKIHSANGVPTDRVVTAGALVRGVPEEEDDEEEQGEDEQDGEENEDEDEGEGYSE